LIGFKIGYQVHFQTNSLPQLRSWIIAKVGSRNCLSVDAVDGVQQDAISMSDSRQQED